MIFLSTVVHMIIAELKNWFHLWEQSV